MDKYHPGYFGKVGMRHFHLKKNPYWRPVVNLDKIWTLAGEGAREQYKNTEKVPVIDALQNVSLIYLIWRNMILMSVSRVMPRSWLKAPFLNPSLFVLVSSLLLPKRRLRLLVVLSNSLPKMFSIKNQSNVENKDLNVVKIVLFRGIK
jgi:hypothetical protein